MKTAILSRDGHYRATLEDAADGVHVVFTRHVGHVDGGGMARILERFTLDVPFHVACDHVHAIVYPLTAGPRVWCSGGSYLPH